VRELEIYRELYPSLQRRPFTVEIAHDEICWDDHASSGSILIEKCRCLLNDLKMRERSFRIVSEAPMTFDGERSEEESEEKITIDKPLGKTTKIYKE